MRGWIVSDRGGRLARRLAMLTLIVVMTGCSSGDRQGRLDVIAVEVTGEEFNWYFRYPGPDNELGTSDDRHSVKNLYLPANSNVDLSLKSNDYVYTFALPDLELEEIAVPGLDFGLQFSTRDEGTMRLLGNQMCGFEHETLIGNVYVRSNDDGFYDW